MLSPALRRLIVQRASLLALELILKPFGVLRHLVLHLLLSTSMFRKSQPLPALTKLAGVLPRLFELLLLSTLVPTLLSETLPRWCVP